MARTKIQFMNTSKNSMREAMDRNNYSQDIR